MPEKHRGTTYLDLPWGEGRPPKLFVKSYAAKMCLAWWLKGHVSRDSYTDWETGIQETYGLSFEPVTGRNAEDMAVVEVRLEVLP